MKSQLMLARRFARWLVALCTFGIAAGAVAPPAERRLVAEPVASGEADSWDGSQFVRADRIGNVFFFRPETLDVYPLARSGKLQEAQRLERVGAAPQIVRDAVLSPGGDVWFLSVDLGVRRFVNGKEKPIPALDWRPSGIGFHRDQPVVSIVPLPVSDDLVFRERKGQVPRLMEFDGDRWNVEAEYSDLSAAEEAEANPRGRNDAVAQHAAFVTSDSSGRLWVARQYAYVVEQLGSSGQTRLRIAVDGGKVRETKPAAPDPKRPAGFQAFRAEAAILDLTEGRDHKMYFLAAAGGAGSGLAIDRYDPVLTRLERVPLTLSQPGRFTIAAGRDGLYLAAWNARAGRWKLSWDALDEAPWKEVPSTDIAADETKAAASASTP